MSLPVAADPNSPNEPKVSARDIVKGAALCLFTICFLVVSFDLVAHVFFPAGNTTHVGEDCMIIHSGTEGVRGVPNCMIWEKPPEGELSDYHFNSSGYRNDHDFGPKPPGTFRIVLLGTSFVTGLRVPQEKTFGALLPAELSQRTGRKVELYNLGLPWRSPAATAHHLPEAIALQPDLILWALTPKDVWNTTWIPPTYEGPSPNLHVGRWTRIKAALTPQGLMARLSYKVSVMRSVVMLRNILYSSPSIFVQASLMKPGQNNDFLLTNPSPKWQTKLAELDRSAADIEEQCRNAGIPLTVVLIPDRTQVALSTMTGDRPAGLDPYKLDNELRAIITSHGEKYIQILPDFRTLPNPEREYMVVDGHANAAGHASIARFLAAKLADEVAPGLDAVPGPQSGIQSGHGTGH